MIDTKEQLHQRLKDIKTQLRLSMNGAVFACDPLMLGCASRITTFLKSLFIISQVFGMKQLHVLYNKV